MKAAWESIQVVLAAIGAWLGWFLGGTDGFLYALIALASIDYITGVMRSIVDKKLSSEIGFRGIFKKVIMFMLVGIGHTTDVYILGSGSSIRSAVIFFYLSNECISLIENAAYIGLPIPDKLKEILLELHGKEK